jgi:DNA mismatch repair protein MutS
VTPELKEYEAKVLGAESGWRSARPSLFDALRRGVGVAITRIQQTARVLAHLDAFTALAEVAVTNRYVRPTVHDGFDLSMSASRHPVIERMMPREAFMPNDIGFDLAARVQLVTGPNMAGKSTILRQIGPVCHPGSDGQLRAV